MQIDSAMRGHHVYISVWTPVISEELYLELEESNEHNRYAVAVRMAKSLDMYPIHSLHSIQNDGGEGNPSLADKPAKICLSPNPPPPLHPAS